MANLFLFSVIAVDIFEKSNFTGAKVPQFDLIKDYPRDLKSSVSFPDTLLKVSSKKGRNSNFYILTNKNAQLH